MKVTKPFVEIIDFNQLPNGLLGITVKGSQKVSIKSVEQTETGLHFAAIAPICGGSSFELDKIDLLKGLPIWAFHGAKDKVIPSSETEKLVERLESIGADVKFKLYPDAEHDSWTATYNNQELYDWLLSNSKD